MAAMMNKSSKSVIQPDLAKYDLPIMVRAQSVWMVTLSEQVYNVKLPGLSGSYQHGMELDQLGCLLGLLLARAMHPFVVIFSISL